MRNNEIIQQEKAFVMMQENMSFCIEKCDAAVNLADNNNYTKMSLSSLQRSQVNALLQQTPQALAAGTLAQAYIVKFPEGMPHTLTALKQGGYGSMIRDNNTFVGSASFYPINAQALALGAFSAMSAVTGQYFLTTINRELQLVNSKLDQIISFLYGEKKAELMAQINFVKYVHENYAAIMMHTEQRVATVGSLQEAKKVAMKDIEFYIADMERIATKETKDFSDLSNDIVEIQSIKNCLEMSTQLYVISGMLELYCSQNFEKNYVQYIERDIQSYINKCDYRIGKCLGAVTGKLMGYKAKPFENINMRDTLVQSINDQLRPYQNGKESPLRTALHGALEALNRKQEFYIDSQGNTYMKINS